MKRNLCSLLLLLLIHSPNSQAALVDRGGGLIYDTILNVTWLQNANGANPLTWTQATNWTATLEYYDSVRKVTWTDWRLPTIQPINGNDYNTSWSYNGSTDEGYNITAPNSAYPLSTVNELAFMFYNNLGGIGFRDVAGNLADPYGLASTGLFVNLNTESYAYFSSSEYGPNTDGTFQFSFNDGYQHFLDKRNFGYAWAVRDGDVAAVPIPGAVWLLGSGLAGIIGFKKIQRNRLG